MASDYPNLKIYDDFEASGDIFGCAVVAQINPTQYFRDRPLFFKYIEPPLAPAINYNPASGIDDTEINLYLDKLRAVGVSTDIFEEQAVSIKEDMDRLSKIGASEDMGIQYPDVPTEPEQYDIKDADGNVIKTVDVDLTKRERKEIPAGEVPITILDTLPDNYSDDLNAQSLDEASIVSLPDEFIKEKLWIAQEYLPQRAQDMNDAAGGITSAIEEFNNVAPEEPDLTTAEEYILELGNNVDVWYGIPLINLSTSDTALEDSYILHVNTRKNWTLDLTNITGNGLKEFEIRLDKVIPPDTRFMAALTVNYNQITIYLRIQGDSTLYSKSVFVNAAPDMQLESFGADAHGTKTLCGYIWDTRYWGNANAPGIEPRAPLPRTPLTNRPRNHFYDNDISRVQGDAIYPMGNYTKPAYNGGRWLDLGNKFRFVLDGYVDRFFCRYNLQKTSFSIFWYQYQIGYPPGIRTLLADSINSNYIRYNYDTTEMIIDFNGVHKQVKITLPEFLWAQFSIRYNMENNNLVISFRDFFWNRYEEISVDIGPDLDFELVSLWGRFNKDTGYYTEIQKGVYGMINIIQEYVTNDELSEYYNDHKQFLEVYDPRELEAQNATDS